MLKKLVSLNLEKKNSMIGVVSKNIFREKKLSGRKSTLVNFFLTFGNRDNSNLLYFIFYNF